VSLLQRRLNVGYARASRMIEMMAAAGILGEYKGSQAREVMMTPEEYERLRESAISEEKEREKTSAEADLSEPAYVNEGQRGYVSTDNEED